jgi:hypothetical protein
MLYLITEWGVNSSGYAETATITVFTDHEQALKAYGKRYTNSFCPCGRQTTVERTETRTTNKCKCEQDYVSETTVDPVSGLSHLSDFQDGSWKRPGGKELRIMHENEVGVWKTRAQMYPENRTYY